MTSDRGDGEETAPEIGRSLGQGHEDRYTTTDCGLAPSDLDLSE